MFKPLMHLKNFLPRSMHPFVIMDNTGFPEHSYVRCPLGEIPEGFFFCIIFFQIVIVGFFAALIWKSYDFFENPYSFNLGKIMTVIL